MTLWWVSYENSPWGFSAVRTASTYTSLLCPWRKMNILWARNTSQLTSHAMPQNRTCTTPKFRLSVFKRQLDAFKNVKHTWALRHFFSRWWNCSAILFYVAVSSDFATWWHKNWALLSIWYYQPPACVVNCFGVREFSMQYLDLPVTRSAL